MTATSAVFAVLTLLGLVVLIALLFAVFRARHRQTIGRLLASSLLVLGLTLSGGERYANPASLTWGLVPIFAGLLLFLFFLPGRRGDDS